MVRDFYSSVDLREAGAATHAVVVVSGCFLVAYTCGLSGECNWQLLWIDCLLPAELSLLRIFRWEGSALKDDSSGVGWRDMKLKPRPPLGDEERYLDLDEPRHNDPIEFADSYEKYIIGEDDEEAMIAKGKGRSDRDREKRTFIFTSAAREILMSGVEGNLVADSIHVPCISYLLRESRERRPRERKELRVLQKNSTGEIHLSTQKTKLLRTSSVCERCTGSEGLFSLSSTTTPCTNRPCGVLRFRRTESKFFLIEDKFAWRRAFQYTCTLRVSVAQGTVP